MRTAFKNPADHPAAGVAGPHFKEQAHTIAVGSLNGGRIVNPVQCLIQDRCGAVFLGRLKTVTFGTTVKGYPLGRVGGKQVQIMVRGCHRLGHLAMYGGHAVEREKVAAQTADQLGNCSAVTTHHTFIRGVDDQQIDP